MLDVFNDAARKLDAAGLHYGHGTDNARDEAAWLICHVLGLSVHEPLPDIQISAPQSTVINALVKQRIRTRQPAAYLTGSAYFAGLAFKITSSVLVPRSPLAEIIGNEFAPWLRAEDIHQILDLGTGSGCIGIACAYYLPHVKVTGSDISDAALQLAAHNAAANGVAERCRWIESDVFQGLSGQQFDLIISNPPYVPDARRQELAGEYQAEPELGLYSGADGLQHAARILVDAVEHLTPNGHLILEIGESASALQQQLPELPFIWPEFEYGGEGVLIADRGLLQSHEHVITRWYQARTGQGSE